MSDLQHRVYQMGLPHEVLDTVGAMWETSLSYARNSLQIRPWSD
jgi:hypothetical protein